MTILPLLKPFYRVFMVPSHQWHPLIVHFPIVFLTLEAFFLLAFFFTRKQDFEKQAYGFLQMSFCFMIIAAAAGFHDCGLTLGSGNKFLLGLQDRWENAFNLESSVTIHFWLALLTLVMVVVRLFWRWRGGARILQGGRRTYLYGGLVFLGLWSLVAMSYVGGGMSHQ